MQEVRDALVAISEGTGGGRGSGLQPTSQQDATTTAPRLSGRAPRTSFTYTSRPSTNTGHTSSFHVPSSSSSSAVAAAVASSTDGAPSPIRSPAATAPASSVTHVQPRQQQQPPPPSLSSSCFSATAPPCSVTAASSLMSLSRMDESQARAATYPINTPLLLQAGAGSGKTQTMAARIVFLLENGVPARSILGICFTRQAAETLRERVRSTLPPSLARQAHALKLKTFHAFGLECLRRFGDLPADVHVLDARQQHQLARTVVDTYAQREKSSEAVAELVDYVNRVKTMKVPPIPQSDPSVQDAYLFPFYQRALHEEHNAVDFGDLQQMFYDLLRPVPAERLPSGGEGHHNGNASTRVGETTDDPSQQQQQGSRLVPSPVCTALRAEYTHFVVDEFQDFNEIQVELLALLAGDACRVTCVGDPNQCIYTWRGAMPNVFGVWKKRFPQTALLTLALNYRSDGPIVDAANRVVKAVQLAHHHREERAVMLVQCATEDDELQAVPLVVEHVLRRRDPNLTYDDIAILCRSRRRVQLYCDMLRAQRIPVRQLKAMSVDRLSTMRSLLAFLRLCLAPHSPEGDADVRTVLTTAPLHRLPTGSAKKFLLSLDSVCQARRSAEAAQIRSWRHAMDDGNLADEDIERGHNAINHGINHIQKGSSQASWQRSRDPVAPALGVHPETHSFFAVLQELVYHNFSCEALSKLEVSKKSQKTVRHMVQMITHAREMLAQSSCDVEQVLRYVLREGGYEGESMCTVSTRTALTGKSCGHGSKRQRCGDGDEGAEESDGVRAAHPKRVGAFLMEQCAADHNERQQQQHQHSPHGWRRRSTTSMSSRRSGAASSFAAGGDGSGGVGGAFDDDVLPAEEESAVWQEQRMNLPELVLHTYRGVHEALQREVAQHVEINAEAVVGGNKDGAVVDADLASSSASQSRLNAPSSSNSNSHPPGKGLRDSPSCQRRPHSGADDSVSVFSNGSCAGTPTLMQFLCPPAVVLRRVLDEFMSLVSSDDYGPMREPDVGSSKAGASASRHEKCTLTGAVSQWIGQVTVGTVHRAKGMEWPAVLLPGCWIGEYPVRPREEEKRVFYVGMSRAMKSLVCFTAAQKDGGSGDVSTGGGGVDMPGNGPGAASPSSKGLEVTPYLAAVGDKLERVAFADLKAAYLKERGYM
ncbi:putative ATP-dependent DNA helicase [Leptomonas seymouri]|uniref:DNA 3'-5' helicase n=1 Tax=Leptomonas seymouri TaxID=5684 RepID=A0A0N0P480_LEPSE|nr:putative ATP-dependent DNA helicase [Leptomonas seymouri]|eukprot:KPI84986.1 putative ATP-dependent DNA helicase [Leptomonas seymouri]